MVRRIRCKSDVVFVWWFNATATTGIYTYGHTLSLHDALPSSVAVCAGRPVPETKAGAGKALRSNFPVAFTGRTSSPSTAEGTMASGRCSRSEEHTSDLQSILRISYAVFCLNQKT